MCAHGTVGITRGFETGRDKPVPYDSCRANSVHPFQRRQVQGLAEGVVIVMAALRPWRRPRVASPAQGRIVTRMFDLRRTGGRTPNRGPGDAAHAAVPLAIPVRSAWAARCG